MNIEMIIINLITNSGDARSASMEAIHHAKKGDFEAAKLAIESANDRLGLAHKSQTELIQSEARGESVQTSLLLVHAQDHLMNAITVKDLATEMIEMYEMMFQNNGAQK